MSDIYMIEINISEEFQMNQSRIEIKSTEFLTHYYNLSMILLLELAKWNNV